MKSVLGVAAAMFALFSLSGAHASLVRVDVSGSLDSVGPSLSSFFSAGDAFSISIILDFETPDLVTGNNIIGVYALKSIDVMIGGFTATHDASVQNGFGSAIVWERTSTGINDTIEFSSSPAVVSGDRADFVLSDALLGASNLGFDFVAITLGDVISSSDLLSALLILDQFAARGSIDFLGDDGFRVDRNATNSALVGFSAGSIDVTFLNNVNEVPLPAALPLFAIGLSGLAFAGRRRSKQAEASRISSR